mmetsp:Transcript_5801/g.21132  ORF Transcript_5801/g.21132 Transcript_5801/m.21132 type:complete len:249 (+) Transcript_5801:1106-1852(+)
MELLVPDGKYGGQQHVRVLVLLQDGPNKLVQLLDGLHRLLVPHIVCAHHDQIDIDHLGVWQEPLGEATYGLVTRLTGEGVLARAAEHERLRRVRVVARVRRALGEVGTHHGYVRQELLQLLAPHALAGNGIPHRFDCEGALAAPRIGRTGRQARRKQQQRRKAAQPRSPHSLHLHHHPWRCLQLPLPLPLAGIRRAVSMRVAAGRQAQPRMANNALCVRLARGPVKLERVGLRSSSHSGRRLRTRTLP